MPSLNSLNIIYSKGLPSLTSSVLSTGHVVDRFPYSGSNKLNISWLFRQLSFKQVRSFHICDMIRKPYAVHTSCARGVLPHRQQLHTSYYGQFTGGDNVTLCKRLYNICHHGSSSLFGPKRSGLTSQQSWSVGRTLVREYAAKSGLQSQVKALTSKKPGRKKTVSREEEKPDVTTRVVAYATAEEYNLERLRKALSLQGLYDVEDLPIDAAIDALYVQAKYTVDDEQREIFFFREGSVIFWNMPEIERKEVLKFLLKHSDGPYEMNLSLHEHEHMAVVSTQNQTNLIGDTIHLQECKEEAEATLEKYAFSNALSQSVKLAIWEAFLDKFVDSIEPVIENLRDGKHTKISRGKILRNLGELFGLRHLINLTSDLLDSPDFYWERENLEHLYVKTCRQLNVSQRTRVMNEKLTYCCELMELLKNHMGDEHHVRLEWMIILLIMVEVVFEIVHYAERYYVRYDDPQYEEGARDHQSDS